MPGPPVPLTLQALPPALTEVLPQWVARQRWYAGKGTIPVLRHVGGLRLEDPSGMVDITVHLLLDESARRPTIYQVPLTCRTGPLAGCGPALVASVKPEGPQRHGPPATRYFYDAPHDPAFAGALLRLMLTEGTAGPVGEMSDGEMSDGEPSDREPINKEPINEEPISEEPINREPINRQPINREPMNGEPDADDALSRCVAEGHRLATTEPGEVLTSHVLAGEQSNTSIIVDLVDAFGSASKPLICKVFRILQDGQNPDVVVQSTLSATGSARVPGSIGYVSGQWSDPSAPAGTAAGHLAFAQEFLPGVEDAWRAALAAVASGADFSERARSLGQATAEVHATLAEAMGTQEATPEDVVRLTGSMSTRHAAALTEVPALVEHDQMIRESIEAVSSASWPVLQRIHGDYHLGQVLDAPGRGWVLVDFEGEPLRPLAERTQPDLALRDVAGMLRSFDYVAGSWERDHPGHSAAPWAGRARTAFLEGYASSSGRDPREDSVLLDALELDKALYEVVYEARNRPTWLSIPITAIARLSARRRSDLRS